MLTLTPVHWYSWTFDVAEEQKPVARLEMSAWREKGLINIAGADYRLFREGVMSGDFVLERDNSDVARATKPNAFRNRFIVNYQGVEYVLAKRSAWRRSFVLRRGDTAIGTVEPTSFVTRDARVNLPSEWPTPVRVFVIWLTLLLWKRESDSAAT